MCGIAGYWTSGNSSRGEAASEILSAMSGAISHRGPDAQGQWTDLENGMALAHRRLSVIDLSEAGAQPMHSASGRYIIIYNGEIYNFQKLRAELENTGAAPVWRGHSDTEVLLAAIECWGLKTALRKAYGMFALALWDCKEQKLFLARDRLGEKPLYYGNSTKALIFASELKAFSKFPGFDPRINRKAVSAFLQISYIPAPLTVFEGVYKLEPGMILEFSGPMKKPEKNTFWELSGVAKKPRASEPEISFDAASRELETLLAEVIESQMLSDVPLGAFLSGGIDSSLVTALMQRHNGRSTNTFSIGFADNRFNEAPHAKQVADHLGTRHTEFMVTDRDALDLVPGISGIHDEPFADSSQLPALLLSRMTRQRVTVALSGDGGDEIFGGYNRHVFGPGLWRKVSRTPLAIRNALTGLATKTQRFTNHGDGLLGKIAPKLGLPVTTADKLEKFARIAGQAEGFEDFYRQTVSTWPAQYTPPDETFPLCEFLDADSFGYLKNSASRIMALDTATYLPDDVLVKVDRAAMSASLETRAPFLDARIVEYAWKLPESYLVGKKAGKRILKDILYRHVPRKIIERPKQGFAVPLDRWLRGELKEWADAGIKNYCANYCEDEQADTISAMWSDHALGKHNNGSALWSVLMLESWIKSDPSPGHRNLHSHSDMGQT